MRLRSMAAGRPLARPGQRTVLRDAARVSHRQRLLLQHERAEPDDPACDHRLVARIEPDLILGHEAITVQRLDLLQHQR